MFCRIFFHKKFFTFFFKNNFQVHQPSKISINRVIHRDFTKKSKKIKSFQTSPTFPKTCLQLVCAIFFWKQHVLKIALRWVKNGLFENIAQMGQKRTFSKHRSDGSKTHFLKTSLKWVKKAVFQNIAQMGQKPTFSKHRSDGSKTHFLKTSLKWLKKAVS